MGDRKAEPSVRETMTVKAKAGEGTFDKGISGETPEGRTKNEDGNTERNKFKKVEIPIFNGEDLDSWLFRVDRYFQIHKLTDAKKILVATISFEGPTLN